MFMMAGYCAWSFLLAASTSRTKCVDAAAAICAGRGKGGPRWGFR